MSSYLESQPVPCQPEEMRMPSLHGPWLVAARIIWMIVALVTTGSFIVSLPAGYTRLTRVCLDSDCALDRLTPLGVQALEALDLSIRFYATYNLLLVVLFALAYCGTATIIFWRRSDDYMALFVSLTLLFFGVFMTEYMEVVREIHPAGGLLLDIMSAMGWVCFSLLFYLFPDGRFVPSWTRLLTVVWAAIQFPFLLFTLFPESPLIPFVVVGHWPPLLQILLIFALFCTCLFAQLYRYRYVSSPLQRQQTKWIVFGMVTAILVAIGSILPEIIIPSYALGGTLSDLVVSLVQALSFSLIPLTIGIAILRYRLWDIDLLINRALVYGTLTASLALIYLVSVVLLQTGLHVLTSQPSDLAIIASTLATAALFSPLRRRIQTLIDRRFYRLKYDAAQTLATFARLIRDEVDLNRVVKHLEMVIRGTMQPTCALTWLRQPGDSYLYQFVTDQFPGDREKVTQIGCEIATQDPLLDLIHLTSDVIELERLELDSTALRCFKSGGVKLIVPLICQGELIGLLSLGVRLSGQGYGADDRRLLANLSSQAASMVRMAQLVQQQQTQALEHERLEQELHIARLVQQTLLPKDVPILSGWQLAVYWQPARAIGGDFYDFLPLPDGRWVVVIGDVADKGVPAALVMATTRAILRGAARRSLSPGAALARANELLYPETPPQMFVTCLYAVLDPSSGRLQYANAGHNLPYHCYNGHVTELRATGMPLGLLPNMRYEEHETTIEPSACVLLCSDGLVEAHNPQREMFGFPRLQALIRNCSYTRFKLVDYVLNELVKFTGQDWEQEDDVTLLTLERTTSPTKETEWQAVANFIFPSKAGCERLVAEQVLRAIDEFHLAPARLERLKTAVAEATMNAIEHVNRYRSEQGVTIQVLASNTRLAIRITDEGGGQPVLHPEAPNLEAKLAGLETPRGWGLFLIEKMVDEVRFSSDETQNTIELILYLTDS